jgi:hypothetical protein
MPDPNAPSSSPRNQNPSLAQLIGSPDLPIGRILIGHLQNRFFHLRSYSVLKTGLPMALLSETFETMLLGLLDITKMLSENPVDLTGLGDVPEKLS